jgi:hypothetical protein
LRGFAGSVKVFRRLKSRIGVLNHGKSSKQITLTLLVFLLTVSIVLILPSTITKTSDVISPVKATTIAEKGRSLNNESGAMEWNKTYGGTGYETGSCIAQTRDGGYIITGYTDSYGAGNEDVWLIKTNEEGELEWNKTYGATELDIGHCVQQTSDGGYIISADTDSFGAGMSDIWLIKTDENGTEEWSKTYGGTVNEGNYFVIQSEDRGYIITGYTNSYGAENDDVWLVKTDENGTEEWNRTYGGKGSEWGYSFDKTSDGGYIITGFTYSYGAGETDVWLIKTDENGTEEWSKTYGGIDKEWGRCVKQIADGGYIITGYTRSYGIANYPDVWLIKTDANGNEVWNKTYGSTHEDFGQWVEQTADGGYIITGYTDFFRNSKRDVWLIKTAANGTEEWNRTYGGLDLDEGFGIAKSNDGGYLIVGYTYSYGAGWGDVWLIKDSGVDNPEDSGDSDDGSILSNYSGAIFIASIVFVAMAALVGRSLGRKIKQRQAKPKEKGEWEGVFFKDKNEP